MGTSMIGPTLISQADDAQKRAHRGRAPPGESARTLVNLANQAFFNEVFFDNVRVPAKNLVGEENRGWYIGTTTLDFERSSIGSAVGPRPQGEALIPFP